MRISDWSPDVCSSDLLCEYRRTETNGQQRENDPFHSYFIQTVKHRADISSIKFLQIRTHDGSKKFLSDGIEGINEPGCGGEQLNAVPLIGWYRKHVHGCEPLFRFSFTKKYEIERATCRER